MDSHEKIVSHKGIINLVPNQIRNKDKLPCKTSFNVFGSLSKAKADFSSKIGDYTLTSRLQRTLDIKLATHLHGLRNL